MIPCVTDDADEDSDLTIFQLPEMLQEQYRRYHGRSCPSPMTGWSGWNR